MTPMMMSLSFKILLKVNNCLDLISKRLMYRMRKIKASYATVTALVYTFVTRTALSRDLRAEMLLIMRPDKPALCRVLYNKKNIP